MKPTAQVKKKNANAADEADPVVAVEPGESGSDAASVDEATIAASAEPQARITMLEEVSPAPRIGHFSFQETFGVAKLPARSVWRVPLSVAQRLQDTSLAIMLEDGAQ